MYRTLYDLQKFLVSRNEAGEKVLKSGSNPVFLLEAPFVDLEMNSYVVCLFSYKPTWKLIHVFREGDMLEGVGRVVHVKGSIGVLKDIRTDWDAFFDINSCVMADGIQKPMLLTNPPLNIQFGMKLSMKYFAIPQHIWSTMHVSNKYKVYQCQPVSFEPLSSPPQYVLPAVTQSSSHYISEHHRSGVCMRSLPMQPELPSPLKRIPDVIEVSSIRGAAQSAIVLLRREVKGVLMKLNPSMVWVKNAGFVKLKAPHPLFNLGTWVLLDVYGPKVPKKGSNNQLVGINPIQAKAVLETFLRQDMVCIEGDGILLNHLKDTGTGFIYSEALGQVIFEKGRCENFEASGSKPGHSWIKFQVVIRSGLEDTECAWMAKKVQVLEAKGNPIGVHSIQVAFVEEIQSGNVLCELVHNATDVSNNNKTKCKGVEHPSRVLLTPNVHFRSVCPENFAHEILDAGGYMQCLALATKFELPEAAGAAGEVTFRTLFAEPCHAPIGFNQLDDNKKNLEIELPIDEVDPPDDINTNTPPDRATSTPHHTYPQTPDTTFYNINDYNAAIGLATAGHTTSRLMTIANMIMNRNAPLIKNLKHKH